MAGRNDYELRARCVVRSPLTRPRRLPYCGHHRRLAEINAKLLAMGGIVMPDRVEQVGDETTALHGEMGG